MKYIRLNITTEGQTEMEFARKTLSTHFIKFGIIVDSRCVMTSKNKYKTYRGGLLDYGKAKKDILRWMAEEKSGEAYFTTMFDLYALPNDFPKFEESLKIQDPYLRVSFLEEAFKKDIDNHKFIPYIQLHEFEALLLSNPEILLIEYPDARREIEKLKRIISENNNNPELVNTGKNTAPSKRIINLIPEYEGNKPTVGSILAGIEGVEIQKNRCIHFGKWVEKIEKINS